MIPNSSRRLFLYGALDSHPFVPSHVASRRCVLSAAAAGAPAGVVSTFAEPSGRCVGAVLNVAGCAVCVLAAPNSWCTGGCAGCCAPPPPPRRMVTCELSRVGCCLRRRQQQISTCGSQEGGLSPPPPPPTEPCGFTCYPPPPPSRTVPCVTRSTAAAAGTPPGPRPCAAPPTPPGAPP